MWYPALTGRKDPAVPKGIVNLLQNKQTRQKTTAHTTNQQAGTRAVPPPQLSRTAPVGSSIIAQKNLVRKKEQQAGTRAAPRGAWEYLDRPPPPPDPAP